ncbi:uncharacterized protein BJX67DRAFT_363103 [Aspergillus lucknowensis]|uniref:Uncharacterized protein n=1 Tax=Aspergillus lucknowensis TaxID=176173 RepID=A0ABR4LJS3_9EURO
MTNWYLVQQGTHARGPSSTSSNPIINPTTTARKRATKKGKANNRQGNGEDKIYTSPNGTRLSKSELKELSLGIKAEGMDKVYFLPCFIEDPWKGLQPMPAVQPAGMAV